MTTYIQRSVQVVTLGAFTVLATSAAVAADKELLDMLLQNGAITQTQYDQLIKKEAITKKDVEDIKVKLDDSGLSFETAEKDFAFRINGRIHADASFQGNDKLRDSATGNLVEANEGTQIRRARIQFSGTVWKDWFFTSEVDFGDDRVAMRDLFLQYTGLGFMNITAGQQKTGFSHELWSSSNDIMFQERSLLSSMTGPVADRAIGLSLASAGSNWTARVGGFGETITPNPDNLDEGWGVYGRATYAPIMDKGQVLHMGVTGAYRRPDDAGKVRDSNLRFRHRTTAMSNLALVDTGTVADLDSISMLGLEAIGILGPFSLEGEYISTWISRQEDISNLRYDGWYAQAAWVLTGESRNYQGNRGRVGRLQPAQHFSLRNGGWGAFELATRYDYVDLNDEGVNGGRQTNFTVALNWYLNKNLRLMSQYTRVLDVSGSRLETRTDGGDPDGLNIWQLRAQLAF